MGVHCTMVTGHLKKASSYIAQYPVLWTVQSALHFKYCLLFFFLKFILQAATSSIDPKLVKNLNALMRHLHKDYIQLKMEASKRFTELQEFIKQVYWTLSGCMMVTGHLLCQYV